MALEQPAQAIQRIPRIDFTAQPAQHIGILQAGSIQPLFRRQCLQPLPDEAHAPPVSVHPRLSREQLVVEAAQQLILDLLDRPALGSAQRVDLARFPPDHRPTGSAD